MRVLILEDDPVQLAELEALVRDLFLEPVAVGTPDEAMAQLAELSSPPFDPPAGQRGGRDSPVLAVVDLDMSLAVDPRHTVDEVLRHLYEQCGGCCVLVHSVRADEILERRRIERIHPLAMFVAKHDGLEALADRVRRMLGVRFGDLALRRGVTFHEPTGQVFGHRVAVALMMGTATGQEVRLDEIETKAARRLRDWLRQVGSPVRLVDHGHRCYGLHLSA